MKVAWQRIWNDKLVAGCQLNSLPQSLEHTSLIGFAGAGDVKSSSVIHGSTNHRKSHSDIHARLQSQHLHRPVSLVVIHGDDKIKISALRPIEQSVGRQRAFDIPAFLKAGVHCWLDFRFFLTMAK